MITLMIQLHDGEKYETQVESYDAAEVVAALNDTAQPQIAIGDVVVFKGSINRIVKLS